VSYDLLLPFSLLDSLKLLGLILILFLDLEKVISLPSPIPTLLFLEHQPQLLVSPLLFLGRLKLISQ